jgi:tRNA(Arg) A34 adenosine deaminase TadA
MLWHTLSLPWQTAVSLAWDAYCAGSLPIGAVIVAEDGRIVAQGCNSIHETESSSPLQGSRLAHAEMNALVALGQSGVKAVPQSYAVIELGQQLFASGELWQLGQQQFTIEEVLIWLQNRLIC